MRGDVAEIQLTGQIMITLPVTKEELLIRIRKVKEGSKGLRPVYAHRPMYEGEKFNKTLSNILDNVQLSVRCQIQDTVNIFIGKHLRVNRVKEISQLKLVTDQNAGVLVQFQIWGGLVCNHGRRIFPR